MQTDIDTDTPNRDVLGRVWYLLILSRPRFWLYLAGPIVVAVAFGATSVSELFLIENIVLFAYFLFPANVFLYGVNDVFDANIDVANPKKEGRETRWQGDPVVAASVVVTTALGIVMFIISPRVAWPYLIGFFILGFQYSAPPLRFKTTPILDSLSNGLYILPGAAAYAMVTGTQPPLVAVAGGWFWTMGMHTFSAIPDIEPDREAGIQTAATFLGEPRVYAYCLCCWLAAAVSFAFLDNRIALLLLAYPVIVFAIYWSDIAVDRAYWWYPAVNTVVGMLLTMGALWRLLYG